MRNTMNFSVMKAEQQMAINGGGFAYDLGRIIRFIGLMGPNGMYTSVAVADWQINTLINEAEND